MTELEYIENGMRLRRQKELAGVRAENCLMRFYWNNATGRQVAVRFYRRRGGKSRAQAVFESFNGHPVKLEALYQKFPGAPPEGLRSTVRELVLSQRLSRVGKGVYQRNQ